MTISYTSKIDLSRRLGFFRLFRLWKGSLIQAVGPDLLVYLLIYYILSFIYRFCLTPLSEDSKQRFEHLCIYCARWSKLIPLSFLLGFYVNQVVSRWWSWFSQISWPDTLALYLANYLPGGGKNREMRRTIIRWVCLSSILSLKTVSSKVSVKKISNGNRYLYGSTSYGFEMPRNTKFDISYIFVIPLSFC